MAWGHANFLWRGEHHGVEEDDERTTSVVGDEMEEDEDGAD